MDPTKRLLQVSCCTSHTNRRDGISDSHSSLCRPADEREMVRMNKLMVGGISLGLSDTRMSTGRCATDRWRGMGVEVRGMRGMFLASREGLNSRRE